MTALPANLAQFGRLLGIEGLVLNPRGVAELQLQSGAVLGIASLQPQPHSRRGGEVLVFLAEPLPFDPAPLLRAALDRAHFRQAGRLPIQVSLRGKAPHAQLLLATRLAEREATAVRLHQVFEHLRRWFATLR